MVPTSPYPNIAASYNLKIVGFRNPMSHFAPTVAGCMSHLAHNPVIRGAIGGCFLRIAKWEAADVRNRHRGRTLLKSWLIESLKPACPVAAFLSHGDYFPLARNPSTAVAMKKSVL
jgi:hypothetical protein